MQPGVHSQRAPRQTDADWISLQRTAAPKQPLGSSNQTHSGTLPQTVTSNCSQRGGRPSQEPLNVQPAFWHLLCDEPVEQAESASHQVLISWSFWPNQQA